MRYGETGVNLEIDLSRGSIEKEGTDPKLTELHLGGLGAGAKILWDRVPPEVEPFSPENLLVFSAGLLTGTPAHSASRTVIGTISPATLLMAFSIMGGFFAPELKFAGYDNIIIRGKSPGWVYLWIHNDKVEIRDASHLEGKGCLETAELIRKELKEPKAQVAGIGLAGENRIYFASIEHGRSSASRGGVGAIMGDKRLKAIVVRGTKDVLVAQPAEFGEFCNDMLKKILERSETPIKGIPSPLDKLGSPQMMAEDDDEWHTNSFAWGNARHRIRDYWNEEIEKNWTETTAKVKDRLVSCYNCPLKCGASVSSPGLQRYFLKCYSKLTYTMAAMLDLEFGYKIIGMAQEYGMDGFSTPQVVAFAIELYEAGILTDQDMPGMPSDSAGRFFWILDKIVRREGIGDILANGTYWAALQIGKGAEEYAHNNIKKIEQVPMKLGTLNYVYFLMYSTGEKMNITQIEGQYPQAPFPTREDREEFVKDWVQVPDEKFKQYYVNLEPRSFPTIQEACEIVDWQETMHYIDDSTGICAGCSSFPLKPPYHIHNLPSLISFATGIDLDEAGLWEVAKRNRTLIRAINVRRGMRRKDERPPEDHWKYRFPEIESNLLDAYYKFKGWNNEGIPTRETLDELGLDYVAEDLERRGILTDEEKENNQGNKD